MEENMMKKHLTAVATIRIALSTLVLIGIMIAVTAFGFAMEFVPAEDLPKQVMPLIKGIFSFIMIASASVSVLGIIAGIGLLNYKSWGRILMLVVSAFSLINIPIGTIVGVYSFWVLMQDETIRLFQEQAPPQNR